MKKGITGMAISLVMKPTIPSSFTLKFYKIYMWELPLSFKSLKIDLKKNGFLPIFSFGSINVELSSKLHILNLYAELELNSSSKSLFRRSFLKSRSSPSNLTHFGGVYYSLSHGTSNLSSMMDSSLLLELKIWLWLVMFPRLLRLSKLA